MSVKMDIGIAWLIIIPCVIFYLGFLAGSGL